MEPATFASLRPDVLRLIECEMYEASFTPGELLMREGEPGDSLMVLMDGQVEIRTGSTAERPTIIARIDGPQIFGEMSLLASEPRTADVVASTPVRAMVLPAASFHNLAAAHPSISLLLTALIAQRLGRTGQADVLWGRTLGEHYQVTGRLGRGGMAVVYDARDTRDGRRVALKMMSHRLVYDPAARIQFQQEADIIESFDHPHITPMLGRFQEFHTFFTVMEFCDGCSLSDILARNGRFDEGTARRILGQIASALAYAHNRGIVHRDVKPGNVMLGCDGKAMLMDFGLAKSVSDTHPTLVESIVGTPRYMAPEQILGGEVGPEADYFSLGLLAWELLSGQPLLPQTDWVGLLRHHANWDTSRLDEQRRRIDLTTYDFLRQALHPEPQQRRVNLEELATWAGPVDVTRLEGF